MPRTRARRAASRSAAAATRPGLATSASRVSIFSAANASDILINRSGTISGATGIYSETAGAGNITVTGFGTVTATNGVGILLQARGGNISVTGGGNISSTALFGIAASATNAGHIQIAPAGTVSGTRGIVANTSFGTGNGTSTVTVSNNVTGIAGAGVHTLVGTGLATVNVTGGTINASGTGGDGILHQGNGGLLLNMTGGQIGTAASRTGAGGINAAVSGSAGGIDITSTTVFSTGIGISATLDGATSRNIAITTNGVTNSSSNGIIALIANAGATGNITITQNGAITAQHGIAMVNNGTGSATMTVNAPVTAEGIGVSAYGGTDNTIINNSTITGLFGLQSSGKLTVINRGSITGTAGVAASIGGSNNLFVMEGPAAALNGDAIGGGNDLFRLAGSGSNSFNVAQIGTGWTLLDKTGTSNWTLTGTATYAGPVTVREGTLTVNGSLASASGISVAAGATIGGSGTLPSTTINAGGCSHRATRSARSTSAAISCSAPARSIASRSRRSQRTVPTSAAAPTLTGATVQLTFSPGLYANRQYTILSATGGLSGTSFGGVSGREFQCVLRPTTPTVRAAEHQSRARRGDANNAQPAERRQRDQCRGDRWRHAAARICRSCSVSPATRSAALDQLSGEVHASTAGVLADESLYVRSAILGRLRQASYGNDMAAMAALSLGGPQVAFADDADTSALSYDAKSPRLPVKAAPPRATPDVVFWAQGFGAWGRFDGDGNAAPVRRDLAGVITGVDTRVGSSGRVGVAAGYTGSRNALAGRGSSNVETAHIAGYGGWNFGAFNLRAGGAYAFHSIATDRTIAFPGFFDRAFANYDGHTGQVFGELGYGFAFGTVAVEPFAGAAWVRVKTDAAAERGGLAALNVAGTTFETGYATLGIRAASIVPLGSGMVLIPRATLAWQHAFDTVTPSAVLARQIAPAFPFGISGVPIARDSLLAEAGLDLTIGRNATIGVSYTGQIAANVQDHAAKGKFSWKF